MVPVADGVPPGAADSASGSIMVRAPPAPEVAQQVPGLTPPPLALAPPPAVVALLAVVERCCRPPSVLLVVVTAVALELLAPWQLVAVAVAPSVTLQLVVCVTVAP